MTPARAAALLWPRPRALELVAADLELGEEIEIVPAPELDLLGIRKALSGAFAAVGCTVRRIGTEHQAPKLRLTLAKGGVAEGYRLRIDATAIAIVASRPAGLFHGVATLGQWLRLATDRRERTTVVPGVDIEDAPALAVRGVLLDVSRDRMPRMETLFELVDWMAWLKVNQLQLYMEHTFAYEGHEEVWRDASPFTAEEIRRLDLYCRERFVELVPCQNSLGHFHRWLRHDRYRDLAEVPAGLEHPFSDEVEPFSLCPTDPAVIDLLRDLYGQLLPNFGSDVVNVGLDETFDLGRGRSASECAERGVHAVYLDFLRTVRDLAAEQGRRIQFWGDVVLEAPEVIPKIPSDVTALVWGYEADHPFDEQAARFDDAGIDFLLCPGTSSWNSFVGRPTDAVANVTAAARAASGYSADGILVCDWGDNGHLQPLPVPCVGLLTAAGLAWNPDAEETVASAARLGELLDEHLFRPRSGPFGDAVLRLGDAHRQIATPDVNGTALFRLVVSPQDDLRHDRYAGLTDEGLEGAETELDAALGEIVGTELAREDGELVVDELTWAGRLARLGCRLGRARLAAGREVPLGELPEETRRRLAAELRELVERHEPLWLARSRPGGRRDSVRRLERTLELLES